MTIKTELKKLLQANDGLMIESGNEHYEVAQGCICKRVVEEEDGFVYEHVWDEIINPDYMEDYEIIKWLELIQCHNQTL